MPRATANVWRMSAAALALALWLSPVQADEKLADVQRTVFVAGRSVTTVAAISAATGSVIGRIDPGLIPVRMQVSEALAKLVAADGYAEGMSIAELASGKVRFLPLAFAPTRLLIGADGITLAAADDASGEVALINLLFEREQLRISGPAGIRDLMFARDAAELFIAAESVSGIAVFSTVQPGKKAVIGGTAAISLARSLTSGDGFALSSGPGALLTHFDTSAKVVLREAPAAGEAIFPTVQRVILPDPASGKISIFAQKLEDAPLILNAEAGVKNAYVAWFGTVAFIPGRLSRSVLIYDLNRLQESGRVALNGTPGPGIVTPEGGKLYLPIEETNEIVAIDARTWTIASRTKLDFAPAFAVMAGGYGICH